MAISNAGQLGNAGKPAKSKFRLPGEARIFAYP